MAEKKNEVAVSFSEMLTGKLDLVEQALPGDFNKTRFVQNAIAVLNDNQALSKINRAKLMSGLLKGAYLGLDFANRECYLIPYGDDVQFQVDYKGMIKFTRKYSIRPIQDIYAKIIREGDTFEEKIVDGHPSVNFSPLPLNEGKIMGVFAVCLFKDGGMQYEVMSTADVQNVRTNYSKASNSKAWKNSFDEMMKKVCLRRLCKHIECDFENIESRKAWDDGSESNVVEQKKSDEIIDVFAPKVENAVENVENSVDDNIEDADFTEIPDDIKTPFK